MKNEGAETDRFLQQSHGLQPITGLPSLKNISNANSKRRYGKVIAQGALLGFYLLN